jgi:lipoprotein NlpD
MRPSSRIGVCCALLVLAVGCTQRPAPVVERGGQPRPAPAAKPAVPAQPAARAPDTRPELYTVRRGDTLYSIALDHGVDYRELAQWNGIENPAAVQVGQQLRVRPPAGAVATAPLKSAPGVEARPLPGAPAQRPATDAVKTQPQGVRVPYSEQAYAQLAVVKPEAAVPQKPDTAPPAVALPDGEDIQFSWPANGKIVSSFYDGAKGIGIAGKAGQAVYASANGRVIFSGTGIRGFGKLIVIKHNNTFLSVYGHNNELLVKEGQNVTKGQKIAEMGNTDAEQVKLHFEIRRFGKPVDPLRLLPQQPG